MRMFKVRQKFIDDITSKYKNQYSINLKSWLPNPYYTLKYKFIWKWHLSILFLFKIGNNRFVTFLNLFLGIVALVIFALNINELKFLAIIIFSKQILDNVDGFIARKKDLPLNSGETELNMRSCLLSFSFNFIGISQLLHF